MKDYTQTLQIQCSPEACFQALTQNIHSWWSSAVEGKADTVNDVFIVHFDNTYKKFKVLDLVKDHKITWSCVDSYLDLDSLGNKSEWNDTKIEWKITPSENGIDLTVTHWGLHPSIGCYDACQIGWDYFLSNSFLPFLEKGTGHPFQTA